MFHVCTCEIGFPLQSCRNPLQYLVSPATGRSDLGSSLVGQLGKADPERLMRLEQVCVSGLTSL